MNLGSSGWKKMAEVGDVFFTETPEIGDVTTESAPSSLVTEKVQLILHYCVVSVL